MGSTDRYGLIAIGVAATLASAAAVRMLDAYGFLSSAAPGTETRVAVSIIAKSPPATVTGALRDTTVDLVPASFAAADRFDFVAHKELLWQGVGDDDGWAAQQDTPDENISESENPDFWAAQTDTAAPSASTAQPQVARLAPTPDEHLPWERPAVGEAPKRSYTLAQRLGEITPAAKRRLAEKFESAHIAWPPTDVALVAVKDEKTLELFTRAGSGDWTFVHRYKVLAASGGRGPKLKRGDKQVPEGVYGIALLNPNSRYHVSLRVNYPNAFDRRMAASDGRKDLGGDIMIHGKNVSIGCLAIGDEAAEELFVLASIVGVQKIKVIIAPTDLRDHQVAEHDKDEPAWVPKLYAELASAMTPFKAPPKSSGLLSFFEN